MIVSKYHVTRHYGGPEEGGWWYDRHHHSDIVFVSPNEVECMAVAKALNEVAKVEKRQPSGNYQGRYSVANHTDEVFMIETEAKKHDNSNDPRPRYE
jgi:hypothetical protein